MLDTKKLLTEMTKRGWTQSELARRAAMTVQQWNNVASGRKPNPELWTVQRMAKAIGCSLDEIVNEQHPPHRREKAKQP